MNHVDINRFIRLFAGIAFAIYASYLIYYTFLDPSLGRSAIRQEIMHNTTGVDYVNLVPFKEINRFWRMKHTYGWQITIMNLAGNVAFFMPFGFLLPSMSREKIVNNFVSVTLLTMVFSMLIETAQLVLKVGAFDVDDIFLNTVGGLLGYIVLKIMKLFMKNRNK